ncbi:MoaF-related domain-containing protein [Spartinivicinus ruber]|uniref:MoaF-related domain-containing protein n=1 Tax=Spartinivicinus ruber TaxID=2683272 RepID=UPI0013D6D662|nr:hypothetical protein [Spartinivicinus ruber]
MYIMRALLVAILCLFSVNLIAGNSKAKNVVPNIVGKTYLYDYGSYAYEITITSKETLHWALVKGSFEGPSTGSNPYVASRIAKNIIYLSWKEESGYQFYNLMNLKTGELTTHADTGEKNLFVNVGVISLKTSE